MVASQITTDARSAWVSYYTASFSNYICPPSSFRYQWEQDQIAHMKNYIARFGHGSAKLARQAQSKEKTLAKMVAGGLTEKVGNI